MGGIFVHNSILTLISRGRGNACEKSNNTQQQKTALWELFQENKRQSSKYYFRNYSKIKNEASERKNEWELGKSGKKGEKSAKRRKTDLTDKPQGCVQRNTVIFY